MESLTYIKRFVPFLKPWSRLAFWSFAISALLALLNLPGPFFTRYVIDKVIPRQQYGILGIIVGSLFFLLIFRLAMSYANGLILAIYRERVMMNLRLKMFEHMERLSLSFYNKKRLGYLMSRISNDTSRVQGVMADTLINFLINLLTFMVGFSAMLYLNWWLTLIALAPLPFIIFFHYRYSASIRHQSAQVQEVAGNVFGVIGESLSGIHVVKSFTAEETESLKLSDSLLRQFKASISFTKIMLTSGTMSSLFGALGPLIIFFLGIREVMSARMTLGSYFAFSAFVGYLYAPAQAIMGLNVSVQDALAALKRVYEIFDTEREDDGIDSHVSLKDIQGNVEFKNVSFSYEGSHQFAVKNVSFRASAGNKYAVVGRSGAGKTTLMNLLCKFYRPDEGFIYVDGIDINKVKAQELRKNISIVPQNPFLFSGSIRENIRLGRISAADEEIAEAARASNIDSFIGNLEMGYDTEIGDRGVRLSGGERQRIAIARAILKNAKILILDEATSEIDSMTEALIQQAMERLMHNRTSFVIAHRFSTILNAEKILFLEAGRAIAQGTHDELYRSVIEYMQLCDEQFRRS
jgi:subfamily B ATP-binding cassette protein MsbA